MKRLVSVTLIIGIIACLALVGLVACKDTRTGYENGDKYTAGAGEYAATGVKKINVAWTAGTANVTFDSEATKITVYEENSSSETQYLLHRWLDGKGTLWIKPVASTVPDDSIPSFATKTLYLTLPKITLDEVYVENHGAEIKIIGANTTKLITYNTGYGTTITETTAGEIDLKTSGITGEISMNGSVTGKAKISAAMGAYLYTSTMPTEITMSGKGRVSCYIPETCPGFNVTVSQATTFTYDFTLPEPTTAEESKTYTYGNGSVPIKLTCATRTWLFSDKTENLTYLKYYSSLA